jgi:hypothetical protein
MVPGRTVDVVPGCGKKGDGTMGAIGFDMGPIGLLGIGFGGEKARTGGATGRGAGL